jgi:hypothetical protein
LRFTAGAEKAQAAIIYNFAKLAAESKAKGGARKTD